MKERPILMKGAMVRATLEDRKTQTRRIVKGADWKMVFYDDECDSWCGSNEEDFMNDPHAKVIPPKYGIPGDRLWVKETWVELLHASPATDKPELCEGDKLIEHATYYIDASGNQRWNYDGRVIAYRATSDVEFCDGDGFSGESANKEDMPKWKPSIFMPRWASRITLDIESVRVERLQEISEDDAVAEGITAPRCEHCGYTRADARFQMDHRFCQSPEPASAVPLYRSLWESINGAGSWDANPWVWVIQFRRITP